MNTKQKEKIVLSRYGVNLFLRGSQKLLLDGVGIRQMDKLDSLLVFKRTEDGDVFVPKKYFSDEFEHEFKVKLLFAVYEYQNLMRHAGESGPIFDIATPVLDSLPEPQIVGEREVLEHIVGTKQNINSLEQIELVKKVRDSQLAIKIKMTGKITNKQAIGILDSIIETQTPTA